MTAPTNEVSTTVSSPARPEPFDASLGTAADALAVTPNNNVLVVDDDSDVRRLLTAFLKAGGYNVRQASNGREALEAMEAECPHFLITDWEMPLMDGLELCRRVHEQQLPNYVYTLFLTARSSSDDLISAIESGADDFLSKPFQRGELLARMRAGARVLGLYSRLSHLANHDPLTELPSRRAFADLLRREWSHSSRYRRALSCGIIDIDFFKRVNDTHGHPVGDEVIRAVAKTLKHCCRESDVLCRYGGEEFCVILPETDEAGAVIWADRFRQRVEEMRIPHNSGDLRVTASVGVAEMVATMEHSNDLLEIADECLLAAKERGRNCVVSFGELSSGEKFDADARFKKGPLETAVAGDAMTALVGCLKPDSSVGQATKFFLDSRLSSAPVVNEEGQLIGIVSEKDALTVARQSDAPLLNIEEIMRSNVITYPRDTPLVKIYDFLCRVSIHNVIITDQDNPVGFIGRASILRWFEDQVW